MQSPITTNNRHALLIGIDQYPLLLRPLKGCVNDATLMREILITLFGFSDQNVTLLTNAQATRDGILKGFEELVDRVQKDDIVAVFYAGHGSQIRYLERATTKPNGEIDPTKLSGWDETIVPNDSGRHIHPDRDITDEEIRRFLLRLCEKTGFVTLIFDCCHSATLHRDAFGDDARWVPPVERWMDERPPSLSPVTIGTRSVSAAGGTSKWLPGSDRYVVIAACQEDEVANEYSVPNGANPLCHGAFTYFLTRQIEAAGPKATYREVFERAAPAMTAAFPGQHAHCEGARDRVLFGVEDIESTRYVLVTDVSGTLVTLDAGVPQGVIEDSEWILYPPGTTNPSEVPGAHPRMRITFAGVTRSKGRLQTTDLPVQRHARAVQAKRPISTQWPVEIHGIPDAAPADQNAPINNRDPVGSVRQLIAESAWLKLAEPGEVAQARIYLLQPRESSKEDDPVPQLQHLTGQTWAVVRRDGQMCMRSLLLPQTQLLRTNLEKWVRHEILRELDNVSTNLADQVDFRLLVQTADESWVPANQRPGEVCTLQDGTPFAFELTSRHPDPLFVAILVIDANGAIQQLYPPDGPSARMAPKRTGRIGIQEGYPLRFRFPKDLSFALLPNGNKPDEVVDYLKLFITTQPMDFNTLLQDEVRSAGRFRGEVSAGSDTALGKLLNDILTGGPAVRSVEGGLPPIQDWATKMLAVRIKRPTKESP